jgi:hypothetical protein
MSADSYVRDLVSHENLTHGSIRGAWGGLGRTRRLLYSGHAAPLRNPKITWIGWRGFPADPQRVQIIRQVCEVIPTRRRRGG